MTSEPYLDGRDTSSSTDDQLLVSVRAGETDAYGELWRRHVRVALAVAGRYSTIADPDDIVQEAFQAVFTAVRDGGGPTRGFRPYLARTVRNVAVSISRRRRAEPVGGLTELADRLDVSVPGHDDTSTDRIVLVTAFQSLPERWRAILWMTEVEDLPVQDAAARLGIAPNAGAALVRRAREGLRRSWLAAHVGGGDPAPECRWVVERLPLAERGDATSRHRERIDAHTATCQDCARAALEIAAVARRLPAVLLPIFFTGGAAAERLLSGVPVVLPTYVGSVGGAVIDHLPVSDVLGGTAPGKAALGGPWRLTSLSVSRRVAAAVVVVVMTAAAVVAGVVLLDRSPSSASAGAVTGSADPSRTVTTPSASGHPGLESGSDTGAPPADSPAPGTTSTPSALRGTASSSEVAVPPAPRDAVTSPPDADVTLDVTGAPASGLREWVPVISGTGTSGSTVEAVLTDGSLIGSAQVADGAWTIVLHASLSADVEHAVAVRYEGDQHLVDVGSYTVVAPLVTGVEVVESQPGVHDVVVLVTGTCGQAVEASVVGTDRAASVVLGSCTTRVPLTAVPSGTHSVELRYVDPVQGRTGAVRTISVTV
jgi:RNA polymerase sigma factor (sigma-70 family)